MGAASKSAGSWQCPRCSRSFTRVNQRHACGTGDRSEVLRNRPEAVVRLYGLAESYAKSLGRVEIVARERYVLLRTRRIFTDLVIMADAVRIAVHLPSNASNPIFFKVVSNKKTVTHVAKLQTDSDFAAIKPYIKEAYEYSVERPS